MIGALLTLHTVLWGAAPEVGDDPKRYWPHPGEKYELVWDPGVKKIHSELPAHEDTVRALLASKDPIARGAGILLLAPVVWEDPWEDWYTGLPIEVVESKPFSLRLRVPKDAHHPFRRSYAETVKSCLDKREDWRVRVAALLYFYCYPDLGDAEVFSKRFDIRSQWPREVDLFFTSTGIGEYVLEADRYYGKELGFIGLIVFGRCRPRDAIEYAIRHLQDKDDWVAALCKSPASFSIRADDLRRVRMADDRAWYGFWLACNVLYVGNYYLGFRLWCNFNPDEEIAIPREAIRAALADPDASRGFRDGMRWPDHGLNKFPERGIELDPSWPADKIIDALEAAYKRKFTGEEDVHEDPSGGRESDGLEGGEVGLIDPEGHAADCGLGSRGRRSSLDGPWSWGAPAYGRPWRLSRQRRTPLRLSQAVRRVDRYLS